MRCRALLTCLWLLADASSMDVVPLRSTTDSLHTPEIVDGIVTKLDFRSLASRKLDVTFTYVNTTSSSERLACKVQLLYENQRGTAVGNISSLRQLAGNKVAFSWYEELAYGQNRRSEVMVANLNECKVTTIAKAYGKPIVVPAFDTVNVFQDNCTRRSRCRLIKDVRADPYTTPNEYKTFDVDFEWSSMRIEYLRSSKDFTVRGFRGNNYKVARMDGSTHELIELLTLPNSDPRLDVVSTGLTFCWIARPGLDRAVRCVQFDEQNRIVADATNLYNVPMTLISAHVEPRRSLSVLLGKHDCCDDDDCWQLVVTRNFFSDDRTNRWRRVSCNGLHRKSLAVMWGYRDDVVECNSGDILGSGLECFKETTGRSFCI